VLTTVSPETAAAAMTAQKKWDRKVDLRVTPVIAVSASVVATGVAAVRNSIVGRALHDALRQTLLIT
jgi:hypothetical protein